MVASLLVAVAIAPWSTPLAFARLPGWQTGSSGDKRSAYGGRTQSATAPLESAAWIARGVRFRDAATADPPNKTLEHLPRHAVIVWAVIFGPADRRQRPIRIALERAKRFACCEAAYVAGGDWELAGAGPRRAYSVIVRIYFGAPPTGAMRAEAQRALTRLELPPPR